MASEKMLNLWIETKVLAPEDVTCLRQLFEHQEDTTLSKALVTGKEKQVAGVFMKLFQQNLSDDATKELLSFFANIVLDCPLVAKCIAVEDPVATFGFDPLHKAITLLNNRNQRIMDASVVIIAHLLRAHPPGTRCTEVEKFLSYIMSAIGVASRSAQTVAYPVHALMVFLRRSDLREAFREAGGNRHLSTLIASCCVGDSPVVVQLTYEVLFCIWVLTYDPYSMVELHERKIIPVVHECLRRVKKEKSIRISTMILRNFANAQVRYRSNDQDDASLGVLMAALGTANKGRGPNFFADMIGIGVLKTLNQRARVSFGDDDIPAMIAEIVKMLEQNMEDLTSFSEYKGEVDSGMLEWSPPHTSAKFWKENTKAIDNNQYEILRNLAALLEASNDDTTVAIACHDFGEVVRHHPAGRKLLSAEGLNTVKDRILALMGSSNPEVAKHALLAIQKIMVQRWEFLQ